jgi:Na+-translocating ferredoxin:NAD+ oxidoreductase RNF subunit RnfB
VANKWMPIVLEDRCTGCGLCVEACGPKSLAIADDVAALVLPDTCGSEEHCISACKDEAIQMAWLPFSRNRNVGRWNEGIKQGMCQHSRTTPLRSASVTMWGR